MSSGAARLQGGDCEGWAAYLEVLPMCHKQGPARPPMPIDAQDNRRPVHPFAPFRGVKKAVLRWETEGMHLLPLYTAYESQVALWVVAKFQVFAFVSPFLLAGPLQGFAYAASRNLPLTRFPQRLGLSAGFWSVCTYPQTGWELEARIRALMRARVRRSARELERPRDRQCRHTKLSVKCKNLTFMCRLCSKRHFKEVKIARSSRAFICSRPKVQRHPVMMRHFHSEEGTLALRRWNRTSWDVGVDKAMSSPLTDMRLPSLKARWYKEPTDCSRHGFKGKRTSRPCTVPAVAGSSASKTCWGVGAGMRPNHPNSWPTSHATTGTLQVLPKRVNRVSL